MTAWRTSVPKKSRRRKPKGPEVNPRLVAFLMRFRGMSKSQATSEAARARGMGAELQVGACTECGEEVYLLDPARPLPAEALDDAEAAHALVCGEHAA